MEIKCKKSSNKCTLLVNIKCFLQDCIDICEMIIQYCLTQDMIAEPLQGIRFLEFKRL
jgi:hypothetical protein